MVANSPRRLRRWPKQPLMPRARVVGLARWPKRPMVPLAGWVQEEEEEEDTTLTLAEEEEEEDPHPRPKQPLPPLQLVAANHTTHDPSWGARNERGATV